MTRLLTIPEVAEQLRVGTTKVYELVKRGDLASVRIGRRRLVTPEQLQAYIDQLAGAR